MSMSGFERLMRDCGLDAPLVTRWREAAAQLPALAEPAVIKGLNRTQTIVLLSRILRRIAAATGAHLTHPDLIGDADFRLRGPFPQDRAAGRAERRSAPRLPERRLGDIWDGVGVRKPPTLAERHRAAPATPAARSVAFAPGAALVEKSH